MSLEEAKTTEVSLRAPQISRLLEVIGYPEAWVSDLSALSDFASKSEPEEREAIVRRVRRAYGVTLRPEDFYMYLWQLVDELERRPRA